jgi:hypothetical protein
MKIKLILIKIKEELNKTLSLDDREKEIIENYFGINTL